MKTILLLLLLSSLDLIASVSIYAAQCKTCHVQGKYLAQGKKAKVWKKILKENTLNTLHLDKNISLPYLSSIAFKEDKTHLKALLQKYSKDRGSHNSCY
ncbi:MAG TPA: hypothetical protein EYO73_04120 [Sulfurimonas sp.]|nr:hypothetical protein [Sulfurimonas sp.]